jgi:hypothetical protein
LPSNGFAALQGSLTCLSVLFLFIVCVIVLSQLQCESTYGRLSYLSTTCLTHHETSQYTHAISETTKGI